VRAAIADPGPGRALRITAGDHRWHAVEWGDHDDPAIVLIHGVT
jgi:pimeloyl-ACP methyl ester carboxylesterase